MVDHLDYAHCTCMDRRDSVFANKNAFPDHKDGLFDNNDGGGYNAKANDKDGKVEVTLYKMISVSSDYGPPTANDLFACPPPLYPPLPSLVAVEADPGVCWTNPLPVNRDTLIVWMPFWSTLKFKSYSNCRKNSSLWLVYSFSCTVCFD